MEMHLGKDVGVVQEISVHAAIRGLISLKFNLSWIQHILVDILLLLTIKSTFYNYQYDRCSRARNFGAENSTY